MAIATRFIPFQLLSIVSKMKQALVFTCLQYKSFEKKKKKLCAKEKLLVTSNFSFSHTVFDHSKKFLPLSSNLKLSSANSSNLEEFKICLLGKGYIPLNICGVLTLEKYGNIGIQIFPYIFRLR